MNHTHFLPSERTSLFFLESTCKTPWRAKRSFQFLGRRIGHKGRRGPSSGTSQAGQEGRSVVLAGGPGTQSQDHDPELWNIPDLSQGPFVSFSPLAADLCLQHRPQASPCVQYSLVPGPFQVPARSLPDPGDALSKTDMGLLSQSPWLGFSSSKQEKLWQGGRESQLACFARSGVSGGLQDNGMY